MPVNLYAVAIVLTRDLRGGSIQFRGEELGRLRKEVRELRMERDVLKKATAFFAKDHL